MVDQTTLAAEIKAEAMRLGFDAVGVAPAVHAGDYPRFLDWLEAGHAADMEYLRAQAAPRAHPSAMLPGVRSLVVVAQVYGDDMTPSADDEQIGKVARFARGGDYHELLWRRLEALLGWLQERVPTAKGRAVADSAPLLERDFARLAGLGWIGKNTLLLNRSLGSYFVLGALLIDLELPPDPPRVTNHCGSCTACLDACPTDAFVAAYQLDARRCIGYWNVEHRGTIPEDFADRLDGWVFGCDICQEVCPWNRKARRRVEPRLAPRPEWLTPDLIEWLDMPEESFRRLIRDTTLRRARRAGLLRNAALVLGACRVAAAVPSLARAASRSTEDPVVREAAMWALRRIDTPEARRAIEAVGQLVCRTTGEI